LKTSDFNSIKQKLNKVKNILITSHTRPDGDAIGSSLGLYNFLIKNYENVFVMVPNTFPTFLRWMVNSDKIIIFDEQKIEAIEVINKADVIFSLDYNSFSRIDDMGDYVSKQDAYKVLIDHHPQPEADAFDVVYSDVTASSTSELMYNYIRLFNNSEQIDKEIAECLYVGIMTDTGSFSFSCDKAETFLVAAELVKKGVNTREIHNRVYDSNTESRLRLIGYSLYKKMEIIPEFSTAIISLKQKELYDFGYKDGDTEGLVNYGLSVNGINFAVLLTEKKGVIRMSMRSKSGFSVNNFARSYFNGGGHERAAGGRSDLSMEDTILKLKELLHMYSSELNSYKK